MAHSCRFCGGDTTEMGTDYCSTQCIEAEQMTNLPDPDND